MVCMKTESVIGCAKRLVGRARWQCSDTPEKAPKKSCGSNAFGVRKLLRRFAAGCSLYHPEQKKCGAGIMRDF